MVLANIQAAEVGYKAAETANPDSLVLRHARTGNRGEQVQPRLYEYDFLRKRRLVLSSRFMLLPRFSLFPP